MKINILKHTSLCFASKISIDCGTTSNESKFSLIILMLFLFLTWYWIVSVKNSSNEKSDLLFVWRIIGFFVWLFPWYPMITSATIAFTSPNLTFNKIRALNNCHSLYLWLHFVCMQCKLTSECFFKGFMRINIMFPCNRRQISTFTCDHTYKHKNCYLKYPWHLRQKK